MSQFGEPDEAFIPDEALCGNCGCWQDAHCGFCMACDYCQQFDLPSAPPSDAPTSRGEIEA